MAPIPRSGRVVAVLGPTNTGKTHLAVERMLGHPTGVIGLPLRLLAREIYDRIVVAKGPRSVALVTGEEKIIPPSARWFVCTVESMPLDRGFDFVAIDEIQLIGDPERGHVFTDRLLHARGRDETMFLGAETAKPIIRRLVPEAAFDSRPRFSKLTYAGPRKLSRLPKRSAIVAFSAQDVYAIAELVRRQRGGAAVVLGALSPRTRNAQVAMFQEREVDFLVATDAIGMGLNMAVDHVAFAEIRKFDGISPRNLTAAEIGQIAGRAGRHMADGTFGTTAELPGLEPELVERVEDHRFQILARARWRNADLDLASVQGLIRSLERPPPLECLVRGRDADDHLAMLALTQDPELAPLIQGRDQVRLLWRVCQVPDFRKVGADSHARLLAILFRHLTRPPHVLPTDWVARQVAQIDRTDGDIDTLSQRIAYVRSWTYIAHQGDWLADAETWCARTRAIEDRLSDALHERLTQRFVDRRTTLLVRQLKDRRDFAVSLDDEGGVSLDGSFIGRIAGLSFHPDSTAAGIEGRALRAAAARTITPLLSRRAQNFVKAPDDAISLADDGRLWWNGEAVARLTAGDHVLRPHMRLLIGDEIQGALRDAVARRLDGWLAARLERGFGPLHRVAAAPLAGAARGLVFQLTESLGALPRPQVESQLAALTGAERAALKALGIRVGRIHVFLPALLKPGPTRLKVLLRAVAEERAPPAPPPSGRISLPADGDLPASHWLAAGFAAFGRIALRIDILERVAAAAYEASRVGAFALAPAQAQMMGCRIEDVPAVLTGLGYRLRETEAGVMFARPRQGDGEQRRRRQREEARAARHLEHSPFAELQHLRKR
ncbi:helicase-related protein [Desertibaculum subflavum]|uniref:helicase-related protein n=1 Tax=Desertibaculum subflavum TaxID=2268458 RepID=UPI000E669E6D